MANEEQLRILKEECMEVWNKWREDNPDVEIELSDADLTRLLEKMFEEGNVQAWNEWRKDYPNVVLIKCNEQTLAQAAEEIQNLLKQLEKTNPTATVEQQQAYVDAAIPPSIKQRCIGALKAGGEVAIEEFLDNPYVNVGKAVVKGWMKPE